MAKKSLITGTKYEINGRQDIVGKFMNKLLLWYESVQNIWIFECVFSFCFNYKMLSIFLGSSRGGSRYRGVYRSGSYGSKGVVFKISNLLAYASIFGTLVYVVCFNKELNIFKYGAK